jgi:uncharacterized membrane protein
MMPLPALRLLLLCCWSGLLLTLVVATLLPANFSVGALLAQVVPLLLTLPGLLRLNVRALQWLGFVVLFLLLRAVLLAFAPAPVLRMLGLLALVLCLALFTAVIVAIRRTRLPLHSKE